MHSNVSIRTLTYKDTNMYNNVNLVITRRRRSMAGWLAEITPNPHTNIMPSNNAWLKLSGKSPMDMRVPPLIIKIMLESNPLKSIILVGRLGVVTKSGMFHTNKQLANKY